MQIDFNDKELAVIELMAPGSSAEQIVNIVLRDWFNANVDRIVKTLKTQDQVLDEIIAAKALQASANEEVAKPPVDTPPADPPGKVN